MQLSWTCVVKMGDLSPFVYVAGSPASVPSESEDESPEPLEIHHPPQNVGHYSLCEHGQPDSLHLATPPQSPKEANWRLVVISQPAPLSLPHQASAGTLPHNSNSSEPFTAASLYVVMQIGVQTS